MKLERLTPEPSSLLDFYESALTHLGALCERTWHDRLEVVAEGPPAHLWNSDGALHEIELHFAPTEASAARDAQREVFPGCPLTFRLAEVLRSSEARVERYRLPPSDTESSRPPAPELVERLWRAQAPQAAHGRLTHPLRPDHHFTLVALVRCEIQAIHQHWSLHRMAISLPDGARDERLAESLLFAPPGLPDAEDLVWPSHPPQDWSALLRNALREELAPDLDQVRARQSHSVARELARVDDYFREYTRELNQRQKRAARTRDGATVDDRLAAARAEHARRRNDQIARHEILVFLHVDALLLVAETAWSTDVEWTSGQVPALTRATFVPRSRRWIVGPA